MKLVDPRKIADLLPAETSSKPDSFKGYTVGDNTINDLARHPWRIDDEKPWTYESTLRLRPRLDHLKPRGP